MVLGNFLNAHTQRSLAVLVDDKLAVGGKFEDLLVLHSVHIVVHKHQPERHSPALHLVAGGPKQMHLRIIAVNAADHNIRRDATWFEQIR